MRTNDYVIIMAGGIGSRFWPLSRNQFPKQFHDVLGTGKSLIQATYERFAGWIPAENIYVVTNRDHAQLVREHLPELSEDQILQEPVGRNTAPCIAYASFKIRKKNPDACIIVAPSDHLIHNQAKFRKDAELALDEVSKRDVIMTLGIPPSRPDTGYGYLQYIEVEGKHTYYKVKTFTEKPSLEIAKTFILSGDFLWNSGMFIFSVKVILNSFQNHLLEIFDLFSGIEKDLSTPKEEQVIGDVYSRCRNISIDYGVMEKEENVYVIPASFDWSDLGTWGSMYEHMTKDYFGNAVQGKVMIYQSTNNIIRMKDTKKLVILEGLDDFIVVDTGDVLMICKKEDEQSIKEIVADIRNKDGDTYS